MTEVTSSMAVILMIVDGGMLNIRSHHRVEMNYTNCL